MRRLIVAITGASGTIYGIRALQLLQPIADIETHLIVSSSAIRTLQEEVGMSLAAIRAFADCVHGTNDIAAPIASGSFRTNGMLIAPCSVRTLGGVSSCHGSGLIFRAADVCLKERRRLVLLFRETPLHAGHLHQMQQVTQAGAIVMPPVPAFYNHPASIDDIVVQTVARALDLFDIDLPAIRRWPSRPS